MFSQRALRLNRRSARQALLQQQYRRRLHRRLLAAQWYLYNYPGQPFTVAVSGDPANILGGVEPWQLQRANLVGNPIPDPVQMGLQSIPPPAGSIPLL
jgi:hypothetical protein